MDQYGRDRYVTTCKNCTNSNTTSQGKNQPDLSKGCGKVECVAPIFRFYNISYFNTKWTHIFYAGITTVKLSG